MCHGNKSKDPAIKDDLENLQYTDLFIKLPFNIDYKQNTICLICAPAKRFKRRVTLSQLQREKKNTTRVRMRILFIYADISLNSITSHLAQSHPSCDFVCATLRDLNKCLL